MAYSLTFSIFDYVSLTFLRVSVKQKIHPGCMAYSTVYKGYIGWKNFHLDFSSESA